MPTTIGKGINAYQYVDLKNHIFTLFSVAVKRMTVVFVDGCGVLFYIYTQCVSFGLTSMAPCPVPSHFIIGGFEREKRENLNQSCSQGSRTAAQGTSHNSSHL